MNGGNLLLLGALVLAAVIGFSGADDPYRLRSLGHPIDQIALDHRDSPYSHITWVVSEANNYAELRFFDKVEGGISLTPSWDAMADLTGDGSLDHLAMPADWNLDGAPPGSTWPEGRPKPNPGTVAKSAYVSIFPAGLLLNERLMAQAGDNPRQATPNILIIGLGSGIGVSVLAHHFPEASIAVVDIDKVVIDMVVDHYPFIAWLREQRTRDGRPRLKMGTDEAVDARQYIRYDSLRNDDGRQYDLVIVDAFTDGSTIPPHLMTREFFAEIRDIMPDDGIILSNVIGSYRGPKNKVVGGSIRAQQAAGLSQVINIPLMHNQRKFDPERSRNNIIIASNADLNIDHQRLRDWTPYPALPTRRFVSRLIGLSSGGLWSTGVAGLDDLDDHEELRSTLRSLAVANSPRNAPTLSAESEDQDLIAQARQLVLNRYPDASGWRDSVPSLSRLHYREIDWVQYARNHWRSALDEARRTLPGRLLVHHGDTLVGPDGRGGTIPEVPLFTDSQPNADVYNR